MTRLIDQLPSTGEARTELQQAVRRVADQLIADRSLADPPKLASNFLNQVVALANGLEAKLANVINQPTTAILASTVTPPTPDESPVRDLPTPLPEVSSNASARIADRSAIPTITGQSSEQALLTALQESSSQPSTDSTPALPAANIKSNIASIPSSPPIVAEGSTTVSATDAKATTGPPAVLSESSANSSPAPTPSKEATLPTTVRGVLDSDLKGQLLELRGRLESIAVDSPSPAVSASIARTDRLIEQLASQQIRNVDGLNQYLSVALPIDPKTGVSQAQLQAFYRKGEGGRVPSLDDSSRFTVALFLQLSRLGDVLATVTGVEGTVSIALTAENSSAAEHLSRGLDELRLGLDQIGQDGAMITVRERPALDLSSLNGSTLSDDLWGDFIEPTLTPATAGSRLDREA